MRNLLRRLLRVFHLGEDTDFAWQVLDWFGLRPKDYLMGAVGGLIAAFWRRVYDTNPLDLIIYGLAVLALILAVIALWRFAFGHRWHYAGKYDVRPALQARTPIKDDLIGDIDASEAFNTILASSAWRDEQIRTTDATNLVSDWLSRKLDRQIHTALVNDRLKAWGEEALPNGSDVPERPIPADRWITIEIMFGPSGRRTCANTKVKLPYTGKLAWAGIKFSKSQFFHLFPLGNSSEWRPVHFAIEHISERIGDADGSGCFPEARRALRQRAYDQKVKLRGRKQLIDRPTFKADEYSEIYTDIEPQYWAVSEINALATSADLRAQANYHTDPQTAYAWGPKGVDERNRYAQLLVTWSDILREWP